MDRSFIVWLDEGAPFCQISAPSFEARHGTIETMKSNVSRFRNGALVSMSVSLAVTLFAMLILPPGVAVASNLGLPKTTMIEGPVAECGGGAFSETPRSIEIFLHESPSKKVIATYTIMPSTHLSFYAFAVTKGTYFLTTNQALSKPPRGNIRITAKSKNIVMTPISTVCQ